MNKFFITLTLLLSGLVAQAAAVTPASCRLKAAGIVVEDLNKNGRLWQTRQQKSGEVEVLVQGGKIWLNLADEEVFMCDNYGDAVCVDYKFQDPETLRVEHQVQLEVDEDGCILRSYQNIVGARPWR